MVWDRKHLEEHCHVLNENKICKQEREEKQERLIPLFLACLEGGTVSSRILVFQNKREIEQRIHKR